MKFRNILTISVPTYNRVTILKVWLEKHAHLMFSNGIRIHVQDNCSNDGTKILLELWKKKFSNISFEINKKNIKIKNLEKCLNVISTNFVWMVGDTYIIDKILLNKVLSIIANKSPLFLITNLNEHIKDLKDSFVTADFVCENLSGILSCMSCTVYNKSKLGKIIFDQKLFSYFPHTLYILDKLKFHDSNAYWISSSVLNLKNIKKENWSTTFQVFNVGAKNWIKTIDSIKGYTNFTKEKAYKQFCKITKLFSFKGFIKLRAYDLISLKKINTYKIYLKKSLGWKYCFIYISMIFPVFFSKILLKIYYKCFRK